IVVDHPATLISLGDVKVPEALMFFAGFVLICALSFRQITGSVMIGIIAVTVVAMMLGMVEYNGIISAPPSIAPTFIPLDLAGALNVGMVSVVFAFLFVD